ncbi:PepSY-like domain-containing protein [uncultured Acetobacteroides sp.]|uniref:PepSY-like domain-containing protein n=1 Tax=uncultured Acetobacteroides sp. TaxID=1760811 RepID=UPI0029F4B027|nr:PepSY-like domain-containing protein [uncultured Acetobacteroides sp.]
MRIKAILVLAAIVAAMLLASCSKSDDVANTDVVSPTAVKAAFESQFPTAGSVSWSSVDNFQVASFTLNSATKSTTSSAHRCTAWYKGNGKWEMTEIEYTSDQLPDTVKKAYTASAYGDGSWAIVKIVKLAKADGTTFFKFELSKSGQNNMLLYFGAGGKLVKVKEKNKNYPDCGNYPNVVSDSLKAAVAKLYPTGTIGEVMQGHWGYWVEVKDGANLYNLFFSRKYELLMSISELTLAGLPQAVQDAFKSSSYASWTVDKIKGITMPGITQQLYLLFVSKDNRYMLLIYGADGKPFGGPNSFGY